MNDDDPVVPAAAVSFLGYVFEAVKLGFDPDNVAALSRVAASTSVQKRRAAALRYTVTRGDKRLLLHPRIVATLCQFSSARPAALYCAFASTCRIARLHLIGACPLPADEAVLYTMRALAASAASPVFSWIPGDDVATCGFLATFAKAHRAQVFHCVLLGAGNKERVLSFQVVSVGSCTEVLCKAVRGPSSLLRFAIQASKSGRRHVYCYLDAAATPPLLVTRVAGDRPSWRATPSASATACSRCIAA